jgi:hypothetical protein
MFIEKNILTCNKLNLNEKIKGKDKSRKSIEITQSYPNHKNYFIQHQFRPRPGFLTHSLP